MLSETTRNKIRELKTRYPHARSAMLPSLFLMQAECGYCTREGMEEVGDLLEMAPADVFSVASFYTMFYKEPAGKKVVDVCTNLACMLNGSDEILAYIGEKMQVDVGDVSPDGRAMLRHVECLGYCERAPVMQIDYRPFGPLTKEIVDRILADEHLLPNSGPVDDGAAQASRDNSNTTIFGSGRPKQPSPN